jgi:ribose transport system permease protein
MTPSAMAHTWSARRTLSLRSLVSSYGIVLALLALVVAVTIAHPGFVATTNLSNILSQWAPAGIMAIGMTYVILTGGFDLSVGANYSLCAVTAAALGRTQPALLSFLAALAVGLTVGALNGSIVTVLRVNPFIATLGTSFAIGGLSLVATGNVAYVVSNPEFAVLGASRFHGVPYSGMVLVAALVVGGLVLSRTVYGQKVYAIGGNAEASRLAGIRVRALTASAYVLSGACAALAGIITASQLGSAQPNQNTDIVFDVITIVVVGGTSLAGGYGAMWRTAVGLAILATLQNGFNLLNVNPYYQNIIKGGIIVFALALDAWTRQAAGRRHARATPQTADAGPRVPGNAEIPSSPSLNRG